MALLAPMIALGDIVVGHSMGGVVAQLVGARVPLRALVLTRMLFPSRPQRARAGAVAGRLRRSSRRLRARGRGRTGTRPRARAGSVRALAPLVRQALPGRGDDPSPVLAGTPTLIVHARDDHHVPVDFAQAALAAHPSWSGAILAHGGHHVHADFPENWLAAVSPWLHST